MKVRSIVFALVGMSGLVFAGGSGDAHGDHASHCHHVAVFGGATIHDSHYYPTVGLDYEFLFHEMAGIVALAEAVFADHTEQIYGLGLAYHPVPALKLAAIPALETADGHSEFLMRGTVEYGFHLGPVTVAPGVSVDYVAEEILYVPGVAVGMGF